MHFAFLQYAKGKRSEKNNHNEENMAYRDNNGMGGGQTFRGDWKCANCGAAITELPFQPDPGREANLRCRDCFRRTRSF